MTSLVKSQLPRQTVCCHFDVGGHGRAHGGRVSRVPRGAYAPVGKPLPCLTLYTIGVVMASFQVEAPVSAPAYERIRDAAAAASTSSSGATSPRLYSPAPAALTSTTVTGQSPTPAGSQVRTRIMDALRSRCGHYRGLFALFFLLSICLSSFFGSRPSDHYFRSVCLSVYLFVCLFVQSFSQPSLIRFRSN